MVKAFSVCFLVATSAACGGDGSSDQDDPGIPRDRKVTEITAEEAERWCESIRSYAASFNVTREQECTFIARSESATTTQCTEGRDECVGLPPSKPDDDCADSEPLDASAQERCANVTFGEMEACARAYVKAIQSAAKTVTCNLDEPVESASLSECGEDLELFDCILG